MRGPTICYSAKELTWIKARKATPRRQLHAEFGDHFNREDVSFVNLKSLCKRKGWMAGRSGCFPKGHVPDNKGKKMPFNPNIARTQFKKGQPCPTRKHVGHERIGRDGYVMISIAEKDPHTGYERRYVVKHRWLWEKENGPVPEGLRLKSLNGDKTNTDPKNWKAIPFALAPRLNGRFGRGYDDAAPELKPSIMMAAELEHKVREIKKGVKP